MKNSTTHATLIMFLATLVVFGCTTKYVMVPGGQPAYTPPRSEAAPTPSRSEVTPPRSEATPASPRSEVTPPRSESTPIPTPEPRDENILWVCSDNSTPSELYEVVALAKHVWQQLTYSEDTAREFLMEFCHPIGEGDGVQASGVLNPVVFVQLMGDCSVMSYSFEAGGYDESVHVVITDENSPSFSPVSRNDFSFKFNHNAAPVCLTVASADYEMTIDVENNAGDLDI